jgi:hypothetical protein
MPISDNNPFKWNFKAAWAPPNADQITLTFRVGCLQVGWPRFAMEMEDWLELVGSRSHACNTPVIPSEANTINRPRVVPTTPDAVGMSGEQEKSTSGVDKTTVYVVGTYLLAPS